jgi:hypothetical protein
MLFFSKICLFLEERRSGLLAQILFDIVFVVFTKWDQLF